MVTGRPLLIVGVPRSGSSWIGGILGRGDGIIYVAEPDNEKREPFALKAKSDLGRFPVLAPDDEHPHYEALWRGAFEGGAVPPARRERWARSLFGRATKEELETAVGDGTPPFGLRGAASLAMAHTRSPTSGRVAVKSVHSALALPWIRERFDPQLVVVLRHPLNVLASMLDLDMPDRDRHLHRSWRVVKRYMERWGVPAPRSDAPDLKRAAWQVGLLQSALAEEAQRGDALAVTHEHVCIETVEGFRSLFERLSIPWTDEVEGHIEASDHPGTGYKTNRVAADQPKRWKRRFGPEEVEVIRATLATFPVPGWPRDGSGP